ncbi:unnamed protein product, partial [Ixodes pacificus]
LVGERKTRPAYKLHCTLEKGTEHNASGITRGAQSRAGGPSLSQKSAVCPRKKFGFRCNTDMDTQDEANIVLTWCSSLSCGDLASPFIRSMDLYVYIYGRQQA